MSTSCAGCSSVTDKPVLAFGRMIHQMTADGLAVQEKAGFPFLQGLEPTLRAINGLWFHAQRAGRAPAIPDAGAAERSHAGKSRRHACALRHRAAAKPHGEDAQEAADAAAAIGFPVVLKIHSADIVHKTEAGGVILNLASRQDVLGAADALVAAAKKSHPNAKIDGFLVQEMVSGVETIVGTQSDPLYGPMLLIGSGGIMVELVGDAAMRLLPVSDGDVAKMIDGLKVNRLLAGYRGKPPADRKALEAAALALGRFYLDHRAKIEEIEINPLIVRPQGAVAVDVRVAWRKVECQAITIAR